MKKLSTALLACTLTVGLTLAYPAAYADTGAPATKKVSKKSHSKKAPPAEFELAVPDEGDTGAAIDPKSSLVTEYHCELGANVTIFRNEGDDQYIALQWQKLITRMSRVGTTTGANRFTNKRSGLTWIGIPTKGILLDAKNGHQLANECKDAQQAAPKAVPPAQPAATVTTSPAPSATPASAAPASAPSAALASEPAPGTANAATTAAVPRVAPTAATDTNTAPPPAYPVSASATQPSQAPIK